MMNEGGYKRSHGSLIRDALRCAWHLSPEALEITDEELTAVAPMLVGAGSAPLVWRRVRDSALRSTAAAELERAYHLSLIQCSFQEQQIEGVFRLLNERGVDALLVKGWALARLYPERGARPCGDIDLIIRPNKREAARAVLSSTEGKRYFVDINHEEFEGLDERGWEKLWERSMTLKLGAAEVRMLSEEDHLRLLCIHLLRHGAWRPLWLCDVAVATEARSEGFDWGRLLEGDGREADWVLCALGLAHHLLGMKVDDTPARERARKIPQWLVTAVLKQWEKPRLIDRQPHELIMVSLRHPKRIIRALLNRWPDPVQATIRMRGPMNSLPRLPFQIGDYATQTTAFVARLPKLLREQE